MDSAPRRTSITGVFAAIFDESDWICLVHQGYGATHWGLPGGGVESGESPTRALQREVSEETGYDVQIGDLVGVYAVPSLSDQLLLCFTALVIREVEWQPDDEISERCYFSRDALPEPMNFVQLQCAHDALEGKRGIVREFEGL